MNKSENTPVSKVRALIGRILGSIFARNLLLLSCLILVPMLIVVFIATVSFDAFTEKEISLYNSRSISLLRRTVDTMVSDCQTQLNYMLSDSDIYLFLITEQDGYMFYHDDVIYKQIQAQRNTKAYLESIYIYSERNERIVSNYGEIAISRFFDTNWLEKYETYTGEETFFYAFRDTSTSFLQPVRMLSFYKTLRLGSDPKGVLVYNVNFDKFARELTALKSQYDMALLVVDENMQPLQSVWDNGQASLLAAETERLKPIDNGYIQAGSAILYKSPIQGTDWHLISVISNEAASADLGGLRTTMGLVILIGFLLVILLTIRISKRLNRPFQEILAELNMPARLVDDRNGVSRDEESYILNAIRRTRKENEEVSAALKERVTLLKRAQAIALQSQINPHFLHNTLDGISWTAMRLTGGKNEASIMLSQLAKMLRYALDNADNLVPLSDELENVRTYLDLQAIRYRDKFTTEWEIDEMHTHHRVPKIMLQPVVENAIQHGIKPSATPCVITISARVDAKRFFILIRDTGIGMDADTLAALTAVLGSNTIREKDSIGLANVHQRIQLFFGEEYGLSIASDTSGTLVTIALPLA